MNDTLQIFDDLKASGVPEAQAHAQAKAIANASRVTPEELVRLNEKIRDDFANTIDKIILKMDINFKYMHGIGGAIFIVLIGNLILEWFKR